MGEDPGSGCRDFEIRDSDKVAGQDPLMVDEAADYRSFRIGLFGLDKLGDIDRTVASFKNALDGITNA